MYKIANPLTCCKPYIANPATVAVELNYHKHSCTNKQEWNLIHIVLTIKTHSTSYRAVDQRNSEEKCVTTLQSSLNCLTSLKLIIT